MIEGFSGRFAEKAGTDIVNPDTFVVHHMQILP